MCRQVDSLHCEEFPLCALDDDRCASALMAAGVETKVRNDSAPKRVRKPLRWTSTTKPEGECVVALDAV